MKIAILTLPLHTNYGGILQAYALQTLLERQGHQVEVLDRPLQYPSPRHLHSFLRVAHSRLTRLHTSRFIRQHIHSRYILRLSDIEPTQYDAFVVGSDQIWRPVYSPFRHLPNAFLAFARNWDTKRYAYAASFGTDKWEFPDKVTPECAELAKQFIAISVREDTGVPLCKQFLGVEAVHMPDPTLVLRAEDYKHLIAFTHTRKHGRLFCYILDKSPDKLNLINHIAAQRSLKPVFMKADPQPRSLRIDDHIFPSVETWLRSFMQADFVLTDSFHGCVFSVVFGKPFVAIGNVNRGLSRMQSLVRMLNIEDHLLLSPGDYNLDKTYELTPQVNLRLEAIREQALNFIAQIN